ncbi:MAG: nitroreductase family protein [Bacilli bacterium]
MELLELMKERHAVRQYLSKPIEEDKKSRLTSYIDSLNKKYGTHVQVFFDEKDAFKNATLDYGSFSGCTNIVVIVGKDPVISGYVGELIALKIQEKGLNSCFVAMSYQKGIIKNKTEIAKGEKIQCSIGFGYGKTSGFAHKSRELSKMLIVKGEKPEHLDEIAEACLLAPTAMNQQRFRLVASKGEVEIQKHGIGFYTDFCLGIVKCHKDLITGAISLD